MKILLIRPRPHRETIGLQHVMVCEPLELEYIASNIKGNGIRVDLVDMILEKRPLEYFLRKYRPDWVAMSGYITHVGVIKLYADRIKAVDPACRIVVGGVHAEVVPEDFRHQSIDFIVESDGIESFKALVDGKHPSDIPGIHREGKKPPRKASFSLNPPDRVITERYRKSYYYMFHNPCALIKTSFGCPYTCKFCFCREITGGRYLARNMDDVIGELKTISEKDIYIVDDDFLYSRERLLDFCGKLEASGLDKRFLVYGRSDFIAQNEDVIIELKERGLRGVIVGLETFRNEDLDKYEKKTSCRENEEAVRILKRHGIEIYGTLILEPDFTKEDFRNLHAWIRKMDILFVNLQPLTPLPGTGIYEEYRGRMIVPRDAFEKWDLAHLVLRPTRLASSAYYFEMIRLYYKIVMHPKHVSMMIERYGLKPVLRLSVGSSHVTWQYIKKIVRG